MRLCIHPRTLANWCCRQRRGEMTCRPRGRPCKESPFQKRLAVAEFLRDTGPGIGVPSLRVAFPDMPPCELTDLRRDYWQVYRHHNRVVLAELTWHSPGRVWAMDHAKPAQPVDGVYPPCSPFATWPAAWCWPGCRCPMKRPRPRGTPCWHCSWSSARRWCSKAITAPPSRPRCSPCWTIGT